MTPSPFHHALLLALLLPFAAVAQDIPQAYGDISLSKDEASIDLHIDAARAWDFLRAALGDEAAELPEDPPGESWMLADDLWLRLEALPYKAGGWVRLRVRAGAFATDTERTRAEDLLVDVATRVEEQLAKETAEAALAERRAQDALLADAAVERDQLSSPWAGSSAWALSMFMPFWGLGWFAASMPYYYAPYGGGWNDPACGWYGAYGYLHEDDCSCTLCQPLTIVYVTAPDDDETDVIQPVDEIVHDGAGHDAGDREVRPPLDPAVVAWAHRVLEERRNAPTPRAGDATAPGVVPTVRTPVRRSTSSRLTSALLTRPLSPLSGSVRRIDTPSQRSTGTPLISRPSTRTTYSVTRPSTPSRTASSYARPSTSSRVTTRATTRSAPRTSSRGSPRSSGRSGGRGRP